MSNLVLSQANQLAERFSIQADGAELMSVLKSTAFKGQVTDAQMSALLIVSSQYGLNPWTKEIYAYPDKQHGIVPVVGVDGWARIINEHSMFDGMDFSQDDESCTCTIYRKDRAHPIRVTEYMSECCRPAFKNNSGYEVKGPWQSHPKRMLRHKALIQCARLAFGFVGIYDQDEAERITEADAPAPAPRRGRATPQDTQKQADASFEEQYLPMLQEAAEFGTEALTNAFQAIPKGTDKSALWAAHSAALKATAAEADNKIIEGDEDEQ